jgi:hypothetical protein
VSLRLAFIISQDQLAANYNILLLAASGNLPVKPVHVQLACLLRVFDGSIALFFEVLPRIPFIQSLDSIVPAIFNFQAPLIWLISYYREFPSAARDILNYFLWLSSFPFPGYFDILRLSFQSGVQGAHPTSSSFTVNLLFVLYRKDRIQLFHRNSASKQTRKPE